MTQTFRAGEWLTRLAARALQAFAFAVGAALLVFPAYKGVWLGYLPLLAALALLGAGAWVGRTRPLLSQAVVRFATWKFLALILIVPAACQVLLLLALRPVPVLDGKFVYEQAVQLAATGHMPALTYYAPAQLWWYALVFQVFGPSPLVAQLSHIPWELLIVCLTYQLARESTTEARARAAGLAAACYPAFVTYVLVTPYYLYMYTALLMLAALLWLRALRVERCRLPAFLAGLSAGLGALTKAVLLIGPAQAWALSVLSLRSFTRGRVWGITAWTLLGSILVVGPWTVRNVHVFGKPVLVCTSGPLVFYSANNPHSNGLYSEVPDLVTVDSPRQMLAHGAHCSAQAWSFIRTAPGQFLRLVILKNLHTWGNETTFSELVNVRGRHLPQLENALSFLLQTAWAAVVFLWCRVSWRLWRGAQPADAFDLLTAILVLSTVLVYSLYEGGSRHHLAVVPLLLIHLARDRCEVDGTQEQQ